MTFVPTPNVAKVVIKGDEDGQEILLTQHWKNTGSVTSANLAELAADVSAWFIAQLIPHLSEHYVYNSTTATDVSVEGGAQAIDITGAGTGGAVAGPAMPANAAFCISLRTGLTGRSNRGRNYIGGLPDDAKQNGSQIKPTYVTNFVSSYNILVAGFTTWHLGVVSKQHNGVHLSVGVFNQVLNCLAVDNVIDSQRRRLPGRGS